MKCIINMLFIMTMTHGFGQVAIGKNSVDGDGILDFVSGNQRGIILPRVTTTAGITTHGTLYYDATDKKVMYRNNSASIDMSIRMGVYTEPSEITDSSEAGAGVIIGDVDTAPVGVLVLESEERALILPKIVSPHLTVENPEAGMICYDTVSKMLCVFNGTEWSFWGEKP